MYHPNPINFLINWKKPIKMGVMDSNNKEIYVVITKKNLIAQIKKENLKVVFRIKAKYLLIWLST